MNEAINVSSSENKMLDNTEKREYYIKAKNVIKNAKINKYTEEGKSVSEQGMTFLGMLTGKNTLQYEKLRNVKLKIEFLQTERVDIKSDYDVIDILAEINSCAISEFNGKMNGEMETIYNDLRKNYCDSNVSDDDIYRLSCTKIANEKSYLPIIHEEKVKGIFGEIRTQIDFFRIENKRLQDMIITERGKIQLETFSGNPIPKIIPHNIKLEA